MSTITQGFEGYALGIHRSTSNDQFHFRTGNEDYVAFRVGENIFFGNVSHGATHTAMVDGTEVRVWGFRWMDKEQHAESSVRAVIPRLRERLDALDPIQLNEGVSPNKFL